MAVILNTIEINTDPRQWLTENINLQTGMQLNALDLVFSFPTSPQTNLASITRNTQVTVTGVNAIVLSAPILVYYDRVDIRTLGRVVLNPRATIYTSLDIISDFSGARLTREDVVDTNFNNVDGTQIPQVTFSAAQNSLMLYGSSHLYPVTNYTAADRNQLVQMIASYGDLVNQVTALRTATSILTQAESAHTAFLGPLAGADFPSFRLIDPTDLPDVNYALNSGLGTPIVISSATNLVNRGNYEANTSAGGFSVTLPSSPSIGSIIRITDFAGTWTANNVTVLNNGSSIEGTATSLVLDVNREGITLVFIGGTKGWSIQNLKGSVLPQNASVPVIITGATLLNAFAEYQVDSTLSSYTIQLPATPIAGAWVDIIDYAGTWATHNVSVSGNGNNIEFSATPLLCDVNREAFRLLYVNAAKGWSIRNINGSAV